jgi:hypothetical protein
VRSYFKNVLIGLDQLANALLAGDPDETISSRLGKKQSNCKVCFFICRVLHVLDPNHCKNSIEKDEGEKWH